MKQILTLIALFMLLSSHELFLKSDTYFLKKNKEVTLYLYNGTFDLSENIISRDRIINPRIVGPDFEYQPADEDYYDKGDVTYLKFKTGKAGTYTAGISTKPRAIELSGEDFTGYLEHEGLDDVIAERADLGISDEEAREKYSKHVKTILQVDKRRTDHYATALNYPIEFIPLKNPYELSPGDEMSFRLLYLGEPLGNKTVHISSRENIKITEGKESALKTNSRGEVSFTVDKGGHWYIATIHMIESNEDDYDYESNWATLTFEVKAP